MPPVLALQPALVIGWLRLDSCLADLQQPILFAATLQLHSGETVRRRRLPAHDQHSGRQKETEGRQGGHSDPQEGRQKETEGRQDGHSDQQVIRRETKGDKPDGRRTMQCKGPTKRSSRLWKLAQNWAINSKVFLKIRQTQQTHTSLNHMTPC